MNNLHPMSEKPEPYSLCIFTDATGTPFAYERRSGIWYGIEDSQGLIWKYMVDRYASWHYLNEKIKAEFTGRVGYRRAKVGEYRFIVNPVNHAEWDKDKTKCTFTRIGYKWLLYLGGFLVGHGFQQHQDEAVGCLLTYYNTNIANRSELEEKS